MGNKIALLLLIAGNGTRMNSNITKQLIEINGQKIFMRTLNRFINRDFIDKIVIVSKFEEIDEIKEIVSKISTEKEIVFAVGGNTRQDSVYNGLKSLDDNVSVVIIHDGARPFVSEKMIELMEKFSCDTLKLQGKGISGGIFAVPVKDTIKKLEDNVIKNIPRELLYIAQTPQIFKYKKILNAYVKAKKDGFVATDDSSIMERVAENISILKGDYCNIKITSPEDLILGNAIIKEYF